MSVQMAAFAFGCFLLMVALVGGGFQVKEIKVPQVGRFPRLTSCAFSLFFLFLGVRPDFLGGGTAPAEASAVASPVTQVVERVVERPILIAMSAPAAQPQVPPADERAPQAAPVPSSARKPQAKAAAAPTANKKEKVPWGQRLRQKWNRFK